MLVMPILVWSMVGCIMAGLLILVGRALARVELKRIITKSDEKEGERSMVVVVVVVFLARGAVDKNA